MDAQAEFEMEFADSEIRQTLWRGDDLHVIFSAVSATRQVPGDTPVNGFMQGVELVLQRCTPAATTTLFGRVRAGSLRVQGQSPQLRMSVPSRWEMPLSLELEPAQSSVVVLQAQAMECHLQTGGVFRESLFC